LAYKIGLLRYVFGKEREDPMHNIRFIEAAVRMGLGKFSKDGALVVETGKFTGRATQEKYVVRRPEVEKEISWGKVNQPVDPTFAENFFTKIEAKLRDGNAFSTRAFVAAFPIEVYSLSPWHIFFANNMFRASPIEAIRKRLKPDTLIRVFHDPYGKMSEYNIPNSVVKGDTAIILDPVRLTVGIVGTAYAGEIKKAAFSLCNFLLPSYGIFPMHSGANCSADGSESTILFGLSGTGKTSLSASPTRHLIGDDEIIWTDTGLSNLEGGCYAKLIDLAADKEPEIFKAVNRFGAIQENVVMDEETRTVRFEDRTKAENTRGSYPLHALDRVFDQSREASAPKNIVFLTADAFGALPAVAKLDSWQAQYHFISGYTARVAGTELGVKEPQATFSACFGAPFMPRPATVYAKLLETMSAKQNVNIWLLNTGWFGGPYGVGQRFPIQVSRTILERIQDGTLAKSNMIQHPQFGFMVPTECAGVEAKYLAIPSGEAVISVAKKFQENIKSAHPGIDPEIVSRGGPRCE
jgi:phosphoenolpyruvate carboxykinase (ATP)